MAPRKPDPRSLEGILRAKALSYAETTEEFPWGERAIKVRGKAFIFMRATGKDVSFSVKLKDSLAEALELGYVEPTHYGLGKHGWVTASVDASRESPVELFERWLEESYRNVAPKKLVAALDAKVATPDAKPDVKKSTRRKR